MTTTTTICVDGVGNITKCSFRLRRDSTEYLVLFFADLVSKDLRCKEKMVPYFSFGLDFGFVDEIMQQSC